MTVYPTITLTAKLKFPNIYVPNQHKVPGSRTDELPVEYGVSFADVLLPEEYRYTVRSRESEGERLVRATNRAAPTIVTKPSPYDLSTILRCCDDRNIKRDRLFNGMTVQLAISPWTTPRSKGVVLGLRAIEVDLTLMIMAYEDICRAALPDKEWLPMTEAEIEQMWPTVHGLRP